jgi:hypothetical protein
MSSFWWSMAAGGFIGTLVLTTIMRTASEAGLTRMDLAFMLGTVVTDDRRKARAVGYLFHFVFGQLFALLYGAFFLIIDRSSWQMGAALGALQAVFVSTIVVNEILPVIHPRMGTFDTAANEFALIEPPGFLMINYGRTTFLVTLTAHVAYGAIVASLANI